MRSTTSSRVLIAELDQEGSGDDHRDAKFTVLAESVRHHIKEEEGEMLPKAKGLETDFKALGEQMLARKKELQSNGIPLDAEHAMVAAVNAGMTPRQGPHAAQNQRSNPLSKAPQRARPDRRNRLPPVVRGAARDGKQAHRPEVSS